MFSRVGTVLLATALAPVGELVAQLPHLRYELGARLRALENTWDGDHADDRRAAAATRLDTAVRAFFRMDVAAVGRGLDEARHALRATDPHAVDGLYVRPAGARWLDVEQTSLTVRVERLYGDETPDDITVTLRLVDRAGTTTFAERADLGLGPDLPREFVLEWPKPVPAGDHDLVWELGTGTGTSVGGRIAMSFSTDRDARRVALDAALDAMPEPPASVALEHASALLHERLLRKLGRGALETDHPADAMLAHAETLIGAARAGEPSLGSDRGEPFECLLRVPVGGRPLVCRAAFPAAPTAGAKYPLVLALHGAGGSENLFFDGYGDGLGPRLAAERGWAFVAPRNAQAGQLDDLLDTLADRWPIDLERVALVGHSMGAALAVGTVGLIPERVRAFAALGGGGRLKAGLERVPPAFVGIGALDFLRPAALALHRGLAKRDVDVVLREYPNVEHMLIVQVALPDVFRWLDRQLQ